MPLSPEPDHNQSTNSDTKTGKVTQKNSGVSSHAKGSKKNGSAKDSGGGGVMAAVKREAKMNAKQPAQTTPSKSPELEPVPPPSKPNGDGNENGNTNPLSSPLLDALSSAVFASPPSQNTDEWTRSVPAGPTYSTSPNNLIHLGESPPTIPSSYEDRLSTFGWNTREQRGIPNGQSKPNSPPVLSRRRPLSYNHDGAYPGYEDQQSQVSAYANRRSSMYSQQSRYGPLPPLPHQNQPHFYGAPDINLLLSPPIHALTPGENGYYCGFDKLPITRSSNSSSQAENVVVAGFAGGLVIHSITKRGLQKLAKIDGLRGGVHNAKILPWTNFNSSPQPCHLVVVVVHGPVWGATTEQSGIDETTHSEKSSATPTESFKGSSLPVQATPTVEPSDGYQTTVEIYSIFQNRHVATLLVAPRSHLHAPTENSTFRSPSPVGALSILADGGNIVLTSGTTGEVWVFRQRDSVFPEQFCCIGKVWTTIQHGTAGDTSGNSGQVDDEWISKEYDPTRKPYRAPILSLNGRWLAYCPPTPSSQQSLRAIIPSPSTGSRIPGLNAHAPPQLPSVNCQVETPGDDSMVKQLMQAGTQKVIEGVHYLGDQGLQIWKNYWSSKPIQSQSPPGGLNFQNQPVMGQHFPPTHGATSGIPVPKDPGLISILDLGASNKVLSSPALTAHPLATFKIPHGCSFLSFSPSGLALFTASSKGDVQFVWDLMRIQYTRSSFLKSNLKGYAAHGLHGAHVRQIAQFSRMTIARVVDVVWTSPHGERAAMVTEPGTVHILDLPASAFAWPPPRKRVPNPKPDTTSVLTATEAATSALGSAWTAAMKVRARPRRSSASVSAKSVTAQAGHGTQVLAATVSRSVGAATGKMNEIRKLGNTRLHLPRGLSTPGRACVALSNGKKSDSVFVLGGGIVKIYTIKNRRADRPADKQKASKGAKHVEYRLPSLPDGKFVDDGPHEHSQSSELGFLDGDRVPTATTKSPLSIIQRPHSTESSIPQAEIESNAPYQPFHTDRRVALRVYSFGDDVSSSPSVSALLSPRPLAAKPERQAQITGNVTPWAFGIPIRSTKLDVGPSRNLEDDVNDLTDHRALPSSAMERVLHITDSSEDVEQIVVTTRRRKPVSRTSTGIEGDEEGFFEDDCEVLDFASQRV